jgi:dephospho-CoA kinase
MIMGCKNGEKMKIGITGGIGSGKSTVSEYLESKGYEIIDCDKLARQVVEKGSPALEKLAAEFGADILDGEGNLDRQKTADIVFHDEEKRQLLNSITHGAIYDIIDEKVAADPEGLHFIDAALMFETGMDEQMDEVWLVTCREDVRKKRIALRDNMDEEMIEARIKSQMPDEIKRARAITAEAKTIVNNAKEDAQRTIEDAEAEADEIVKSAQIEADRKGKSANEKADNLVARAEAEADAIIKDAERRSAEMVAAHQITQLATEQARETVDDAKRQAYDAKMGARSYVDDMLGDVEHTLMEYVSEIQACRKQFK